MKPLLISILSVLFFLGCDSNNNENALKSGLDSVKNESASMTHETIPFNAEVPNAAMQIKLALLAAPPEKRDSATVYGYDSDKNLVIIKKGSNEMICLASNPDDTGFSVSCYTKNLEPLMQRGRELRNQGFKGDQLFDERAKEVKNGTLKMPDGPSTLFVYTADSKDVDQSKGEVKNGYLRYVIYIPFATAESTGLPTKPSAPGMPWIMDPGTYRAHVMINP
jgi:hypothetical protein